MPSRGVQKVSRNSSHRTRQALAHVLNHLASHDLPLQTLQDLAKLPTVSRALRNSFPKTQRASQRTSRNVLREKINVKTTVRDLVKILVKMRIDPSKGYRVGQWRFTPHPNPTPNKYDKHQIYWLGPPGPMFGFKYTEYIYHETVTDVTPMDIVSYDTQQRRFTGQLHPSGDPRLKDFIRRVCIEAHALEHGMARQMATDLRAILVRMKNFPNMPQKVGQWRYDPSRSGSARGQLRWTGPPGLMVGYVFAKFVQGPFANVDARKILAPGNSVLMPDNKQIFKNLIRLAQDYLA